MELANWETMPMLDPKFVESSWTTELKVFFPPNEELQHLNTLLLRSAIVLVGPHNRDRYLPHRLATDIAATLGRQPQDFTVSVLHPSQGDLIVTFPSIQLEDHTLAIGMFTLAYGVEVQLREWSPHKGMVRDPTSHVVRIKLHGVPLQYWNLHDVDHLVSGFGEVVRMAPVFTNGNFETLRVLVACYNPVTVPPTLWLTKNPYSVLVDVELEGWLHNSSPILHTPTPAPDAPDDQTGSSSYGDQMSYDPHYHN